jgi:hypothetical protein
MNHESSKENLRKYAWDYFQLHASQRLTTFNFYIVISSAIVTVLFTVFEKTYKVPSLGILLGFLLIFFSFVFWKLDSRTKFLIKQAEEALKYLESISDVGEGTEQTPHVTQIFMREDHISNISKRGSSSLWNRSLTYSDCFNLVFFAFSTTGLLGIILSLVGQKVQFR